MKREEITELTADFERAHPVEEWKVFDWHVWPMVRNSIAFSLYYKPRSTANLIQKRIGKLPGGMLLWDVAARAYLAGRRVSARALASQLLPPTSPADVIIMTPASRRIMIDGVYCDPYGDPIASLVSDLGLRSLTWETGKPKHPRARPACSLKYFARDHRPHKTPNPPGWFLEVRDFFKHICDTDISWRSIFGKIYHVERLSRKVERWLRRSGAKYLVVYCWYCSRTFGATLGADRADVTSIDLQHGLHDRDHFGYGGWNKVPEYGYELVPDVFWCWGRRTAEETLQPNRCFRKQSEVLVGGNLWLNNHVQHRGIKYQDYLPDGVRSLINRAERCLLVTLQHPDAFDEKLARVVRELPDQWLWLVRAHPSYELKEYSSLQSLMSSSDYWINTNWANELPLYHLFQPVDLHVTGWSTCAQEALAFGVPTVLLHQSGCEAYRPEVQNSVMLYLDNPQNSPEIFQKALDISQDDIYEAAEKYFCPPDKSVENISRFFESADHR